MGRLDHMIAIFLVPEGTAMLFYNGYTSLRAHGSAQGSFFLPPPHPHVLFLLFFVAAVLPCEVVPLTYVTLLGIFQGLF